MTADFNIISRRDETRTRLAESLLVQSEQTHRFWYDLNAWACGGVNFLDETSAILDRAQEYPEEKDAEMLQKGFEHLNAEFKKLYDQKPLIKLPVSNATESLSFMLGEDVRMLLATINASTKAIYNVLEESLNDFDDVIEILEEEGVPSDQTDLRSSIAALNVFFANAHVKERQTARFISMLKYALPERFSHHGIKAHPEPLIS